MAAGPVTMSHKEVDRLTVILERVGKPTGQGTAMRRIGLGCPSDSSNAWCGGFGRGA